MGDAVRAWANPISTAQRGAAQHRTGQHSTQDSKSQHSTAQARSCPQSLELSGATFKGASAPWPTDVESNGRLPVAEHLVGDQSYATSVSE